MTEPHTRTVSLSYDALKILRWLAGRKGGRMAVDVGADALGIQWGRKSQAAAAPALRELYRQKFVATRITRYRITPAGRAFIEQIDGKGE